MHFPVINTCIEWTLYTVCRAHSQINQNKPAVVQKTHTVTLTLTAPPHVSMDTPSSAGDATCHRRADTFPVTLCSALRFVSDSSD